MPYWLIIVLIVILVYIAQGVESEDEAVSLTETKEGRELKE